MQQTTYWLSAASANVLAVAFFAVTLVHGLGWDGALGIRQQRAWAEHAAFMDGLVEDGLIVMGGPLGDGERALHMVEAGDEQEVRRRLGEDPWARMGLLEIGAIEPWAIWLDGRLAHQTHREAHPHHRQAPAPGQPPNPCRPE